MSGGDYFDTGIPQRLTINLVPASHLTLAFATHREVVFWLRHEEPGTLKCSWCHREGAKFRGDVELGGATITVWAHFECLQERGGRRP